jgi:putative endonuclease
MSFSVYILQSESSGRFYIGQTNDLEKRMHYHNFGDADKYTLRYRPWRIFLEFAVSDRKTAKKIEAHIKRMKSTKYISNLKEYSDLREKLISKYSI